MEQASKPPSEVRSTTGRSPQEVSPTATPCLKLQSNRTGRSADDCLLPRGCSGKDRRLLRMGTAVLLGSSVSKGELDGIGGEGAGMAEREDGGAGGGEGEGKDDASGLMEALEERRGEGEEELRAELEVAEAA